MNLTSRTPKIELLLRPDEVLSLDNRQHRMAIECRNGVIWVTREGGHGDHILSAGSRYVPSARGCIVIQAIGESRVNIVENI
ncbi:MAG: DUF2917 domain-containing protein [Syntrophothermus sp.]